MLFHRVILAASAALLVAGATGPAQAGMPIGTLDEAQPTWVGGWAFDPDHPGAEIAIHVYVDGQFAGNGETKGYRPDVNAAYGLTGNHGFTFEVDIAAFGPGNHEVVVYGIDLDGEGNPALDNCPKTVNVPCVPSCAGKTCGGDGCGGSCGTCMVGTCVNGNCSGLPVGQLDDANTSIVGGWAFDPDHPNAEIAIHIYVNGEMAQNGVTTGYRPDVNETYGISGNHGFTIPVDFGPYGPGTHEVKAHAIDPDGQGNPALPGSPKYVTVGGCAPDCAGKACGSDGCGGSCGACPPAQTCSGGICVEGQPGSSLPEGHLDEGSQAQIGGWAKDPDWDGPIAVHVYVDGQLVKVLLANEWREDVGAHGFSWAPPPFGHGAHQVVVYAIGVDAGGALEGQNPALDGSPATLTGTCDGLTADALGWCQGMAPYWDNRQADTVFVGNDSVRVGVDTSFGGTIFQLYGPGWDSNLVLEHGGGAVQLSIWGYDPVGGAGWYGTDGCDPTWYPSPDTCAAAGHAGCSAWAHPGGAHAADCTSVFPCGGWTPGAPWNPIQAQGPGCGWDSPQNDCDAVQWAGGTLYTRLDAPFHFTSTAPPAPMPMEQWVTAHWGYAEIHYRLTYAGPYTWTPHPQEIPAIFAAAGMNQHYYYYGGDAPFTGGAVTHQIGPETGYLRYPGQAQYGHGEDYFGYAREGWWGVCDGDQDRCLTVASFSPLVNEVALHQNQSGGSGYITALGYYGVQPGMDLQWTIYVFPKRWDEISGDKTVREHIYALAPPGWGGSGGCEPSCGGKVCGPDGCGGACGQCAPGLMCSGEGLCLEAPCNPDCGDKQCGDDGCGGSCGDCPPGFWCAAGGQCLEGCTGNCEGKVCGPDGCGGSCGACDAGEDCVEGQCQQPCQPSCAGKACGGDGCGGICGTCGFGLVCTGDGLCLPEDQVDPEDRWKPGEDATGDADGDAASEADLVGGELPGDELPGGDAGVPAPGDDWLLPDDAGGCPDGYRVKEGRCVAAGGGRDGGGCAAATSAPSTGGWILLVVLAAAIRTARRRAAGARRWAAPICLVVSALAASPAAAVEMTLQEETTPRPGVTLRAYTTTGPKTNLWAVLVDLCEARVHVDATDAPSSAESPASWGADVGVQIATNGDFYKLSPLHVYGQAVGNGLPWPAAKTGTASAYTDDWYYKKFGWIAFGHDFVEFSHSKWAKKNVEGLTGGWKPGSVVTTFPPGTLALVSGFSELVIEGTPVTCSSPTAPDCFPDRSDMRERHPRTAMGITEDRETFLLLVVDGRTSASLGMYGTELADVMQQLGAWEAFNLDGGGSSQLWVQGQGTVNNASGNNLGGGLRPVVNHWGIYAGNAGGKPERPGHCVSAAPCGVLGPGGGIVDDGDPCFLTYGPPVYWRSEDEGWAGGLRWTNAWGSTRPWNWAWWRLHLEAAGQYRVDWYATPAYAVFDAAHYEVRAGGETHVLTVDQSQADGWTELGIFDFAAGGAQWVAVYDDAGGDVPGDQHIVADAIRLVRLDPWCGDGTCDPSETCDGCPGDCGPCATPDVVTEGDIATEGDLSTEEDVVTAEEVLPAVDGARRWDADADAARAPEDGLSAADVEADAAGIDVAPSSELITGGELSGGDPSGAHDGAAPAGGCARGPAPAAPWMLLVLLLALRRRAKARG